MWFRNILVRWEFIKEVRKQENTLSTKKATKKKQKKTRFRLEIVTTSLKIWCLGDEHKNARKHMVLD